MDDVPAWSVQASCGGPRPGKRQSLRASEVIGLARVVALGSCAG